MQAVIKTGGKQYNVKQGDVIKIEKLENATAGSKVVFDNVLMVVDGKKSQVGSPNIANFTVSGEVIEQGKDKKVIIFKKNRRHNYRRKNGHRQQVAWVKIGEIGAAKAAAKPAAKASTATKDTAKPAAAKKPAAKKAATTTAKKPAAKKAAPKKPSGDK